MLSLVSVRATRWHCCGAAAFWEVPRYGDVIRHSAEERPIKHTLLLLFFFWGGEGGGKSTYC